MELSDRNASEGVEPRNLDLIMMADCILKQERNNWLFVKARTPVIIGVLVHSMIAQGIIRNLGDPLCLPTA